MTDFQPIETLPAGTGTDASGLVTYQNNGDLELVSYPASQLDAATADVLVAQQTAEQAVVDAAAAQSTADTAQTTADAASAAAVAAQAAADAAQATADTAFADALAAQTTADSALATANTALANQYYDYAKFSDVFNVADTWTAVGSLSATLPSDGVYVLGMSSTWTYDSTTNAAMWRWRINGGTWNENAQEPKDVNDTYTSYYAYPNPYVAGALLVEVEAQKSAAGGTLDVQFLDIFVQRVGQ